MVKIYQFVGTFEFYEISNYIWILYGIFLLIYATNSSNLNLFKTTLFGWGYCTAHIGGGLLVLVYCLFV